MRIIVLLPALLLFASFASAAQLSAEYGASYLLEQRDVLDFGDWQVTVEDASPPSAIAVTASLAGEERIGFTVLRVGDRTTFPFATLRLNGFTEGERKYANVSVLAPEQPANQTGGTLVVNATPSASQLGSSPRPTRSGSATVPQASASPQALPDDAPPAYPEKEITGRAEEKPDCSKAIVVDAVAILPKTIEIGGRVNVLLEDEAELSPLPARKIKATYPSGRSFELTTGEGGSTHFDALEPGTYALSSLDCYVLSPISIEVKDPARPPEAFDWLPPGARAAANSASEFLRSNLPNLLYLLMLLLFAAVAWLSYSFIKANVDLEDMGKKAQEGLEKLKSKLSGHDEAQTAVEYLLVLGGVIFLAVIVISMVRTQLGGQLNETMSGNIQNFTSILNNFNKSK